jgi:hypothetical protein
MSYLSIRRMHDTQIALEQIEEMRRAAMTKNIPHVDWFDWIVTRPMKRGKCRRTVTILYGFSKDDFCQWWIHHRQPGWTARVLFNPQTSLTHAQKPH